MNAVIIQKNYINWRIIKKIFKVTGKFAKIVLTVVLFIIFLSGILYPEKYIGLSIITLYPVLWKLGFSK